LKELLPLQITKYYKQKLRDLALDQLTYLFLFTQNFHPNALFILVNIYILSKIFLTLLNQMITIGIYHLI